MTSYDNRQLLKKVAIMLTEHDVVTHPSSVAIADYNLTDRFAKYSVLFDDWNDLSCHYSFHELVFSDIKSQYERECTDIELPHDVIESKTAGRNEKYRFLQKLSMELKKIHFHLPVTEEIYKEVLRLKQSWHYADLMQHKRYLSNKKERGKREKSFGHINHWEYGLLLEKIYLNVNSNHWYSTFFINNSKSDTISFICAACKNSPEARKISVISSIIPEDRRITFIPDSPREYYDITENHKNYLMSITPTESGPREKYITIRDSIISSKQLSHELKKLIDEKCQPENIITLVMREKNNDY